MWCRGAPGSPRDSLPPQRDCRIHPRGPVRADRQGREATHGKSNADLVRALHRARHDAVYAITASSTATHANDPSSAVWKRCWTIDRPIPSSSLTQCFRIIRARTRAVYPRVPPVATPSRTPIPVELSSQRHLLRQQPRQRSPTNHRSSTIRAARGSTSSSFVNASSSARTLNCSDTGTARAWSSQFWSAAPEKSANLAGDISPHDGSLPNGIAVEKTDSLKRGRKARNVVRWTVIWDSPLENGAPPTWGMH